MKFAQQLKEKNIAEYLIYMWQVEDLLRANKCNIEPLRDNIISRYSQEDIPAVTEWYENLIGMMYAEGVTEKGHLQINRNIIQNLAELHGELLLLLNIHFIMRLTSRLYLLLWSYARRVVKVRSRNLKLVSKLFMGYCCYVCKRKRSAREQLKP